MTGKRAEFEQTIRSLILPLYLPMVLIMFGYGMIVPILPLFARSLGAGLGITGVIVSARAVGAFLFDLPAGAIISRMGKFPALLLAVGGAVLTAAATGLVGRLLPLGLLTAAMGAVNVLWVLSVQTHIRQNLPAARRGRAMSLVGGTLRVGGVAGPILGGYLARAFGLNAGYFGQAVLCAGALAALVAGSTHYRHRSIERKGAPLRSAGVPFLRTLRGRWKLFLLMGLGVVILAVVRSGRRTLLPLWGAEIQLDVAQIGLVFGLARAAELLLFYPAGVIMDRWGRKRALVPCLLLLSVGLALVPVTHRFGGLVLVSLIAGVGNGLGSGIVLTLGADMSPRGSTGEFLGVWHLVGDLGAVSGPLIVGAVAEGLGLGPAALLVAAVGVAGALFMALRMPETLSEERRAARP